ncbi:ATP-binding protein [Aurantiacibacter luteus]|uniref:ATP-binding protein n=1 Tax=Aurantiacibacter luteus TaxID=1581420 RepID=UPI00069B647B|nr:ATP-binding protein [Aurantiacibacter luteus]
MSRILLVMALVLVPLSLLGVGVLIRGEFEEVRKLRSVAEDTVLTRDELDQLLVLHLDAETGVRGYVLTGNPAFLDPYEAAVPRRDALFAALDAKADPDERRQLDSLLALSDAKLENAARNIADVRAGRPELARARIADGGGKRTMDQIRRAIAQLQVAETAQLHEVTSRGTGSRNDVERTVTLLLAGVAVLLAFVTLLVSNSARQRRRALERAEHFAERQRAMFDGAVDGMLWLDARGNVLRMNPSISRMFGYSEAEVIGRHNLMLMHHRFSMTQSLAWLESVGEAGADGAGRRQEFTGKRADGSTFETEIAISRVDGEDSAGAHYIASIRDISDRKRAERMKTEFVSTVSHELRTPLTSIGGSLGLVLGGATGPLEDKTRRLIGIAHDNSQRLIRLINDILDIEKIESGKMDFDIRRIQVGPLVRRTIDEMTGFAEKHEVAIAVSFPPWPLCIMGDPDRLDQLLVNLVSNAIKHSPPGGRVEIACSQDSGMARIEVRDRGAGIPLDFRERIFGKFAQADSADNRARGGTGLGLSIAREIAVRHEGAIGFDDREGGGTVFHVTLPLAKDQSIAAPAGDADLPLVLHVDDDADCLSVVASAFAGSARVVTATTLREARYIAERQAIAAAVIDVGLGRESGLSLLDHIREADRGLPIVLFTALDDPPDAARADRLLVKSRASVDELVAATMALIETREREAA